MIRVNRGAQDVSLYTHSWRPSKAMLDPSQVSFSTSVSYLGILVVLHRYRQVGGEVVGFEKDSLALQYRCFLL